MRGTRVHVRVTGRVQGVGYRFFVRDVALGLDLSGWVRNRRDASVEAQLEGPSEAVDAALAALREGPPLARVAAIEVLARQVPPTRSAPAHFTIRETS